MITIDISTGAAQFDLLKRVAAKIPFKPVQVDRRNRLYVEEGVIEFEPDNNNSSFWLDRKVTIYDLKLNNIEIPAAIIQVSARKNIVKTPLAGQDMSVKEIVGFEDFQVQVAGIVLNENPIDLIDELNQLFRLNEALTVQCDFLRRLEIHYIVIEDYVFPPIEALENVIPFEFSALSDQPIELELKNGLPSEL